MKEKGFYFGKVDGQWGNETGAAVTRFQIRNGLEITGRLDPKTLAALGVVESNAPEDAPQQASKAWPLLVEEDERFLESLTSPVPSAPTATPEAPAARTPATADQPRQDRDFRTRERLRDWVAAFVLAGLDATVESELQFFAEGGVDYFGKGPVDRAFIRRDLQRYNERYPRRRFWLSGDPEIVSETGDRLVVRFPLRYEVSGPGGGKSGEVLKTLELRKSDRRLAIVGVSEKPL